MRIVTVDELMPEMILAREVIDRENGRILLAKGSSGLVHFRERLRQSNIRYLYVEDPASTDLTLDSMLKDEIRSQAEATLQDIFGRLQSGQEPEYRNALQVTRQLIQEILSNRDILINVYELRCKGGDFFGHSVNVAFLSLLLGIHLLYSDRKLRELGIGALLHDIGVTGLPTDLIKKKNSLTFEESLIYEQHGLIGYQIVKDSWEVSPLSRGVILSHHERSDGSGYPHRLLKGDIHEYSRIVGLADCFEDLAGGHPLSRQMKIQEAVELLNVKADEWFEADMVKALTRRIPVCPTGTTVRLTDGRMAVVVAQNSGFPTRPVLRIFQDQAGHKMEPGLEIDLLEHNHLLIE